MPPSRLIYVKFTKRDREDIAKVRTCLYVYFPMSRIRTILGFALFLPLAGLGAQAAKDTGLEVLTLEQCLQAALAKSDSGAILEKNLKISQAQYKQIVAKNSLSLNAGLSGGATGGLGNTALLSANATAIGTSTDYSTAIPLNYSGSVSLNAASTSLVLGGGGSFATAGSTDVSVSTFSLALSQTVWDGYPGGVAKANVRQGLLNLQNAELANDASRLGLAYQIRQAYYTMLSAQRNLDVYARNLELQTSALAQEQALYDLQQAVDVDLQTAKINRMSAEIDQKNGKVALDAIRKALANLVGLPMDAPFLVADTPDPKVSIQSLEEAKATALGTRVELKQLDVNRRIAAVQLGLIKAQTSPTVALTGASYWLNGLNAYPALGANIDQNAMTISLGGKIGLPILDSGSAAYLAEANRYQQSVYDFQGDQLRRSIALDVENAYQAVQLQSQRLELSNLTADNSADQYNLKKIQRQYGTATNQDVLAATVNMVNASNARAAARNALELAILQLQNAMGL